MLKPYFSSDFGDLYHGHSLDVLKTLPDDSVNCCVTSPPYWGLRDYDLPPMVWGGLPNCDHVWGDSIKIHKGGPPGNGVMLTGGRRVCGEHIKTKDIVAGKFCQNCGAWYGSLGLEPTPELYIDHMVEIFGEVLRILKPDGTLWLNIGDSYVCGKEKQYSSSGYKDPGWSNNQSRKPVNGYKPKDLVGIPWMLAFALRANEWFLRSDIVWHKPNPMPESVKDRPTKSHEYIFLFSKSQRYYYDHESILEPVDGDTIARCLRGRSNNHKFSDGGPVKQTIVKDLWGFTKKSGNKARKENKYPSSNFGVSIPWEGAYRNKRSVWTCSTKPFSGAHFAVYPPDLIEPCILAGCPEGGTVIDPFIGSGTTGIVSYKYGRKFIGIDLSEAYLKEITVPRIERTTAQMKLF